MWSGTGENKKTHVQRGSITTGGKTVFFIKKASHGHRKLSWNPIIGDL